MIYKMGKKRLDIAVTELGLAPSRERAKAMIMAGEIYVNNAKALKAGETVSEDALIEFRGKAMPYVSRGGYKLEKAMQVFPITLEGKVCMDIGASTGGFTDCMLQNGAKKVYAIDVGYGQLAWKLRTDARVVNLERTNFRYCTAEQIPEPIEFASIDVSFISLSKILPVLHTFLKDEMHCVALIKPQFEAGREKVGKKGVVRDIEVHKEVVEKIVHLAFELGFRVCGLSFSPIRGPEGNIEYLIYLQKSEHAEVDSAVDIETIVNQSHESL